MQGRNFFLLPLSTPSNHQGWRVMAKNSDSPCHTGRNCFNLLQNCYFQTDYQQTLQIQIQVSKGCQKIRKIVRNPKRHHIAGYTISCLITGYTILNLFPRNFPKSKEPLYQTYN